MKYKIEALLNHGKYYSKNWVIFSYITLILGILSMLLLIVCAILASEYLILLTLLLVILGIVGCLCIILNNWKLKHIIELCLPDCVEVKATAEELGIINNNYGKDQIGVRFTLNGQEYFRMSVAGSFLFRHIEFNKYAGKKINILYSPKYDEVMILKD
ncbi:MAG: hypothetical protein K2G38_04725 [Clostridia bacterium]|nr:hypothetical protein [Clostridia bacterium]